MNILIVDGNEKQASHRYTEIGMQTQFEVYENILRNLLKKDCNIVILHPAYKDDYIPPGVNLGDFHGIVWTGSLLNIYDFSSPIERQIELAKELFKKENKIFGSCWGLQVLATAAGGIVKKNPKGLEAVIAKNISINKIGESHQMYLNKPKIFDSFCWHYDEVESLPERTQVLSSNEKCNIQSIIFNRDSSEVWAVQYHPEFDPKWISGLMKQRKNLLIEEGIFDNSKKFNELYNFLSNTEKYKYKREELSISNSLIDQKIHTTELSNWLNYLTCSI